MDLIEYISGPQIAEVFADFATFHKTRKKPLKPVETYAGKILQAEDYAEVPIDTEDYASVLFRFAGGAHGVLTVSQVSAGQEEQAVLRDGRVTEGNGMGVREARTASGSADATGTTR